ncbi:MAG: hypothetical protein U0L72_05510 [Acutalibacteraceae bacterium]|nr:hypothetical protein [Acutalibacteraceae bacterium]
MKKFIKRISFLILALCICLLLCSCKELDEMKANRAVFTDETYTEILFDSNTYKLIYNWPEEVNISYYDSTMVSEKEVPVLLSTYFGKLSFFDAEKRVLCVDYDKYYCREDVYNSVINIDFNNLNTVCYSVYNEESGYEKSEKLSENIAQAITLVLDSQPIDEQYVDTEKSIFLYKTDESLLIQKEYVAVEKAKDGNIYLGVLKEYEYEYYLVPDNLYKAFDNFIGENPDAVW